MTRSPLASRLSIWLLLSTAGLGAPSRRPTYERALGVLFQRSDVNPRDGGLSLEEWELFVQ